MNVRTLRYAALPALLGGLALVACSSTPPAARAYVTATVEPGQLPTNGSAVCMFGQQISFVIIGTPTSPLPTTVIDGNTQAGAPVHVTCSVHASGDGFDVQASANVGGDIMGGTLTISGHVNAMGGSGLSATFNNASNGTFSQASSSAGGCTITYTGDPPPENPAVAAGRIWGHVDCQNASRSDELAPNPDGSMNEIPRTCYAFADFLFENCDQ